MMKSSIRALLVIMQLIGHSSGAWFVLESGPELKIDSYSDTPSSKYMTTRSCVVACALRCHLTDGDCEYAAVSQHCSLLPSKEDFDQTSETDVQVFQYTDLDECSLGMAKCHEIAICTNTIASFTCSCPTGYAGNGGTKCVNIDECSTGTSICHQNATCADTDGSYTCKCQPGLEGDGVSCEETSKCTSGNHNCPTYSADCVDQPGSFSCTCKKGFIGEKNICRASLAIHFHKKASTVPSTYTRVNYHSKLSVCLWMHYASAGVFAKVWYDPNQDQCYTMSMDVPSTLSHIRVAGPGFIETYLPATQGVWHHVCATRSKYKQSLYIDKIEYSVIRNSSYPDIPQSFLHIALGNPGGDDDDNDHCPTNNAVNTFTGVIKDVFVWTEKLSNEEVERVYDGSDIPQNHMWISWTGAFKDSAQYPEQKEIAYEGYQLNNIHTSKS